MVSSESTCFATADLLYPNMEVRIRPIRARTMFYMMNENRNVNSGIVIFSVSLNDSAKGRLSQKMSQLTQVPIE